MAGRFKANVHRLSDTEIADELTRLSGWSLDGGKLHREYKFKDFVEAFAFMTRAAQAAEEQAHHPEWLNIYNSVVVHLSTHDVGGVSDRDFRLARTMDSLLSG